MTPELCTRLRRDIDAGNIQSDVVERITEIMTKDVWPHFGHYFLSKIDTPDFEMTRDGVCCAGVHVSKHDFQKALEMIDFTTRNQWGILIQREYLESAGQINFSVNKNIFPSLKQLVEKHQGDHIFFQKMLALFYEHVFGNIVRIQATQWYLAQKSIPFSKTKQKVRLDKSEWEKLFRDVSPFFKIVDWDMVEPSLFRILSQTLRKFEPQFFKENVSFFWQ
jgi:hypothetical protein